MKALARTLLVISMFAGLPATARPQDVDAMMKTFGAESIRSVDSDLCLPVDSDEYIALGKNAVLKLTSRSAVGSELPLRSVYLAAKDLRIPLQRIARMEKTTRADGHTEQGLILPDTDPNHQDGSRARGRFFRRAEGIRCAKILEGRWVL